MHELREGRVGRWVKDERVCEREGKSRERESDMETECGGIEKRLVLRTEPTR